MTGWYSVSINQRNSIPHPRDDAGLLQQFLEFLRVRLSAGTKFLSAAPISQLEATLYNVPGQAFSCVRFKSQNTKSVLKLHPVAVDDKTLIAGRI
jgi:hypothetical protein